MLVNEAIIDVAIGAAKFRGDYQGGMPTIGCPGCNGETMEQTTSRQTLLVNALLHRLESDLNRGLAQAEQSVPPSFLVRRSSCP